MSHCHSATIWRPILLTRLRACLPPDAPHVVGAQSYRLSTVDAHTVALQTIHGKITRHHSRYCTVAFCYVHNCELSYIYLGYYVKLYPHWVLLSSYCNLIDNRNVRVFVTYTVDSKTHRCNVLRLCECLKRNHFSVSLDVRETHLLAERCEVDQWHDHRYNQVRMELYKLLLRRIKIQASLSLFDPSICWMLANMSTVM